MNINALIEREGLRRGLRPKSISTYCYTVNKFLRDTHLEPHQVRKEDIENYLIGLIKKDSSGSTVKVYFHALLFLYRHILGMKFFSVVPPIHTRKRLPEFLTQEEILVFFQGIHNPKHRLIIFLTYGAGLRVNEVLSLKLRDLDLSTGFGLVREGKGGKERMFIIPQALNESLAVWVKENNLQENDWLFLGYNQNHYSPSSVRAIVKRAQKEAKIAKKITPHILRHSFATHLLENGYSLIELKELLGHSRMETTMIYTHLAHPKLTHVQSPLDTLPAQLLNKP